MFTLLFIVVTNDLECPAPDMRPCTVGGTRCRGVYTSSVSWRTYTMMRSLAGGTRRARLALGPWLSETQSSVRSFVWS